MHIQVTRNSDAPGKEHNTIAVGSNIEGFLNLVRTIDSAEKERVATERENAEVMAGRGLGYAADTKYDGILISTNGDDGLILKILD